VGEFLENFSKVAVLVFVVTCMVTAGLGLGVRDIVGPLRRGRLVLAAVVANFVFAPAVAYGLTAVLPLQRSYAIGLLLLGGAAGAPFLPKLAALADGDAAFSVGMMLLLTFGSVAFLPIAMPLMIPGLAADTWTILKPLLFTLLLPMAAGIAFRYRSPRLAGRLIGPVGTISNVAMLLAVVLLIGINFGSILGTFGSGAAAVGTLFVTLCLGFGYAIGGPTPATRSVLGLGTGQRNIAAALLLATQNYPDDPGVVVMLLVTTFAGVVVLAISARWFAKRTQDPGVAKIHNTEVVSAGGL
jgi:BASS family bile acid:Na+ symporter